MQYSSPQYVQNIESKVSERIKNLQRTNLNVLESKQKYLDEVLEIYKKALEDLIDKTVGSSVLLRNIKNAYNDALAVRNERIKQFITQDRVFGISAKQKETDTIIKKFTKENDDLKIANRQLRFENIKLIKDMGKTKDEQFSDYLLLMRERDSRYTLYFENVALHLKLKELDGTCRGYAVEDSHGDPVVLRIALDRCREQLSTTQTNLKRMMEEYSETVPRRDFEALESRHSDLNKTIDAVKTEYESLQNAYRRVVGQKKCMEEELLECQERCRELERSGTPRPRWEVCADFIGGGRDRWRQLANGLSSRERLLVLLKELGPAAESEHLEYFDGLGTDPAIPPYLRHEGRVRNLRLSRREVSVIINDIWVSKVAAHHVPMQEYVTRYFEDRYQQASVRAEWAYNLCAGAEQMLDEPQMRLWWGALTGGLAESVYWGLRRQWTALRDACTPWGGETISLEEFEKVTRALFPLKSEMDIKNLTDVVKKQLKLKLNHTEIHLDKLFYENEEGFDRTELARELYRQRQQAQDKYLRELVAELAPRRPHAAPRAVTVDALKRAFAIIDPAIADEKNGESEYMNLKVLGQDNAIVQFKIKKHTPLRKLMNAYCDRAGLSMQVVRFRFDGQPINENDTPTSLEMEEGDTIEVYQQQTGGAVV